MKLRKRSEIWDSGRNHPAVFALKYGCFMVFICVICAALMLRCEKYTEEQYALAEIESGVYAIKSQGVSTSSLCTYDMVELCIDGSLQTFRGAVAISYIEDGPYAVVETNGFKNRDEVHVYIPKGTLKWVCGCGTIE